MESVNVLIGLDQYPIDTILKVDLYGTALVLEVFGNIIAWGGSGVVKDELRGHRVDGAFINGSVTRQGLVLDWLVIAKKILFFRRMFYEKEIFSFISGIVPFKISLLNLNYMK